MKNVSSGRDMRSTMQIPTKIKQHYIQYTNKRFFSARFSANNEESRIAIFHGHPTD